MKKSQLRYIIRKIIQEQASAEDVPNKVKPDGSGGEPPTPTFYCDDPEAINYTPNADPNLIDNNVCVYQNEEPPPVSKKLGCKNPNDINFCSECIADTNPTSCAGIRKEKETDKPGKAGCMDNGSSISTFGLLPAYPGYAACNYDPDAVIACNVNNPNHKCCTYDSCMGCMVPSAEGYDPEATIPCPNNKCCGDRKRGSDELNPLNPPIPGCTNPIAQNYNSEATEDDGSCDYGSISTEGNTITYSGIVGVLQILFDQGPCGPDGDNPDIYPMEVNTAEPPWCGGDQCTCIIDELEEAIIPDSIWGLMDNTCQFIQNLSLGQDIIDLPGQMFDYNLTQLPGVSSWISETNETFLENNPNANLTPGQVLEMVTSFEDYLEGALGFGIACENGQWNGIYNEDNTASEVLLTLDWFTNPVGQVAETLAYLFCQIDLAMCNGNLNPFNQLPQNGPGGCGSTGCQCCKHPFWGLCPGAVGTTYTVEGIFDDLNIPQEVRDQINVDQNYINAVCQYFPVYDGEDGNNWWAWWNSHQVGNSWQATIDNISPNGNLPCGWGSSADVQASGYCPSGLTCYPCGAFDAGLQANYPSCAQTGYACIVAGEGMTIVQEGFTSLDENYNTRNYHNIRNFKKTVSKNTVKTRLQELAGIRKNK